jgi:Uroporphyrinogen decarboxylase (URO-D)
MNSRERVVAALNHHQPDKVPFDLGGTTVSSLHVSCVAALRDWYGLPKEPVTVWALCTMPGIVPPELGERMGVDTAAAIHRSAQFGLARENLKVWRMPDGLEIYVPGAFNPTPDGEGGWYLHPQGDTSCPPSGHMPTKCYYFDNVEPDVEVDEDRLDPADNLEEFGLLSEAELDYIVRSVEAAYATGRAVILNAPAAGLGDINQITGHALKRPKGIRHFEEWYISPLIRPDYVRAMFEGQMEFALANIRRIAEACGDKIDVVYTCGTDFGHQNGQFCSRQVFREVWLPSYRKLNDWIHANTGWKIFKHCCGSVTPLVPCFIDAGFDVLNPIQISAVDMDPRKLKQEFGRDIAFWGGGVDTQQVLPFGSPTEVRRQVLENCEIFGRDGGYVFNAVHNVQREVPLENLVAMIDAVKEFNGER